MFHYFPRLHTEEVVKRNMLALAGVGLACMPRSAIEADLQSGSLERLLPEWSDRMLGIYLVWAKNADHNKATRRFIDHMASK